MMERVEARGRALGETRARQAAAVLAERLAAALPGARVSGDGERVSIEGHGLWREGALRWIAGWLR